LEGSEVERVTAHMEADDYYKPKDPNEPGISDDEKNKRIANNAAIAELKTFELAEASQRDAAAVRSSTVEQAYALKESPQRMNGNPQLRLTQEQKDTLRVMASTLYEDAQGNKESLQEFIATVEK